MTGIVLLIVIGTTIWMAVDAYHDGRSWGNILCWILGALLLWIVTFPVYLVNRRTYAEQEGITHGHV